MKMFYVSDSRWYKYNNQFYCKVYLHPDELARINDNIDEITFWGRIYSVDSPDGLKLIKGNCKTNFVGLLNPKSGFAGYISHMIKTICLMRQELITSDFVYFKFSSFSSYLAGLFLNRKKKKCTAISQLVGDFDCLLYVKGYRYKFINYIQKKLYKKIIRKCDLQIYVSKLLETKYKVSNIPSIVLNENRVKNSQIIDTKSFLSRRPEQLLSIIFIGRLSHEKCIMDLVYAVEDMNNVILNIVGDGELFEPISEYISKHNLQKKIFMKGFIPWGDNLFSYMGTNHVLVLPSRSEGLPLVILEAMSFGVAVVASAVGGIPEIVKHQQNGLLFKTQDIDDLRKSLQFLYDNETKRIEYITSALQTAKDNSIETQNMKLKQAILEVST